MCWLTVAPGSISRIGPSWRFWWKGTNALFNQYGVIVGQPGQTRRMSRLLKAQKFVDWLISAPGQTVIANYKIGGESLFFPNAGAAGN
jgi:tungstate transport system substrate-binding protein